MHHAWHEIAYYLGLTSGNSPWYLLHSGVESNLGLFTALGIFLIHKNCHTKGCKRIGHPDHHGVVHCRRHLDVS